MSKKNTLLLIICCWSTFLFGQTQIKGVVYDASNQLPLLYANVALLGAEKGAITNTRGGFEINCSDSIHSDSLLISYIGYQSVTVSANQEKLLRIYLQPNATVLKEVVVRPISAKDQLFKSLSLIDSVYADTSYTTKGYYNLLLEQDDRVVLLKEAIAEVYTPSINNEDSIQIQLLQAKVIDDLDELKVVEKRRKKRNKKQRTKREKGKAVEVDFIDKNLGGPYSVLSNDPARNTAFFLNPKLLKKMEFNYEGYAVIEGRKTIVIGFVQQKKYYYLKTRGKVFIDLDSDAIIAMEVNGTVDLPTLSKPAMALAGFKIKQPQFNVKIIFKPLFNTHRWRPDEMTLTLDFIYEEVNWFSKNDSYQMLLMQSFIVTDELSYPGQVISKPNRFHNRGFSNIGEPAFWITYNRPIAF